MLGIHAFNFGLSASPTWWITNVTKSPLGIEINGWFETANRQSEVGSMKPNDKNAMKLLEILNSIHGWSSAHISGGTLVACYISIKPAWFYTIVPCHQWFHGFASLVTSTNLKKCAETTPTLTTPRDGSDRVSTKWDGLDPYTKWPTCGPQFASEIGTYTGNCKPW